MAWNSRNVKDMTVKVQACVVDKTIDTIKRLGGVFVNANGEVFWLNKKKKFE